MNNIEKIIVTLGGYYTERRQALGYGLSPRLPKGGLRRKEEVTPRG